MNQKLKEMLHTAIVLNNFNFSQTEREHLFTETVSLIETNEQKSAELEAELQMEKEKPRSWLECQEYEGI